MNVNSLNIRNVKSLNIRNVNSLNIMNVNSLNIMNVTFQRLFHLNLLIFRNLKIISFSLFCEFGFFLSYLKQGSPYIGNWKRRKHGILDTFLVILLAVVRLLKCLVPFLRTTIAGGHLRNLELKHT